ncbi:molybdopterin biosynthesis protein MoeB [Roseateles aquatilis]|uniref:Molybdopterin-synthase adenylyltransferase n=1 Tax=Roseateles aquatilis TaxID=431061 RepID=A0A246JLQ0_9BURK|nr:HesA/MoeB/ThiF family protein [Roseateles aquatilis]OWQ93532.1 molybdopterin biosynthesis protein MoeB [Roseateles aquatilis]
MDDEQLLRYSRHILLDDIGVEGQQRLLDSHALVIGAGGLGSPVALYLGTAGVGRITLVDHDHVDLTNLQRQIAHSLDRVGQPKALSAAAGIAAINPEPKVRPVLARADATLLDELVPQADVVLDCTDNFATRHLVNAACVRHGKPLVSGAALGFDAQLAVYDSRVVGSAFDLGDEHDERAVRPRRFPCYACLFPPDQAPEEQRCAVMGVFAPLVGIIGSMQAAEALKLLSGMGSHLPGRLLMLDARRLEWTDLQVAHDPRCPCCGDAAAQHPAVA